MWEVEEAKYVRKTIEKVLTSEQDRRVKTFHAKIRGWRQVQVVSAAEEDPTHPQVCK